MKAQSPVQLNGEIMFKTIKTAEEITTELQDKSYSILRQQRDQFLAETDWWCASDQSPTPEQLDYRQALRDLPANSTPGS